MILCPLFIYLHVKPQLNYAEHRNTVSVKLQVCVCFTFILTLIVPHVNSCTMAVNYQSSLLEFESTDFFCDITIMCLSCRSSWRRCRRRSSRESSREKDLQQLREAVASHKVSLEKKKVCLSLSSFSLKPESLCVLTALCTDSSGGQWEDLYWAHPLHWEKPFWADTADQRSGKARSESSWRTTGATGAGDQWSEEERRWDGAAFTHTGSHPVPAGNIDLKNGVIVDLSRSCRLHRSRRTDHSGLEQILQVTQI